MIESLSLIWKTLDCQSSQGLLLTFFFTNSSVLWMKLLFLNCSCNRVIINLIFFGELFQMTQWHNYRRDPFCAGEKHSRVELCHVENEWCLFLPQMPVHVFFLLPHLQRSAEQLFWTRTIPGSFSDHLKETKLHFPAIRGKIRNQSPGSLNRSSEPSYHSAAWKKAKRAGGKWECGIVI